MLKLFFQFVDAISKIPEATANIVAEGLLRGSGESCKTDPALWSCQIIDSYQASGPKTLLGSETEVRRMCRQWPDTLITMTLLDASSRLRSRLVKDVEADVARDCKLGDSDRCYRSRMLLLASRLTETAARLDDGLPHFDPIQVENDCLARNGLLPEPKSPPAIK